LFISRTTVEHNYIAPSSTVGIQLHFFGSIYGPSSDCDLTYRAAIQDMWGIWGGLGEGNEIYFPPPNPPKNTPHILYNCSVSNITTWRWPTYRAETCSCIPTVPLGAIYLCSTVRLTQKILCYHDYNVDYHIGRLVL